MTLDLQHPATHPIWEWLNANRESLDVDRVHSIQTTLRELDSLLWKLDREVPE